MTRKKRRERLEREKQKEKRSTSLQVLAVLAPILWEIVKHFLF
jgi:hypothetical protein